MEGILGTIGAAAGLFAGTNIDDLIVLSVLFATGRPKPWQIWLGQYLGIGALVTVSAVAAAGLTVVPDRWVGLLGLIPLALGLRGLIRTVRARGGDQPPSPVVAKTAVAVAAVTIANGADNIAVYTPLFRTIGVADSLLTVAVFAVLVAVWCLGGSWLGTHRRVAAVIERFGHWIVPIVFIALGVIIMIESAI